MRTALQQGQVWCVVVAADATARSREKVVRLAIGRGIPLVVGPPAAELGARLGRPVVMVAGVLDRALARGLAEAVPGGAPLED